MHFNWQIIKKILEIEFVFGSETDMLNVITFRKALSYAEHSYTKKCVIFNKTMFVTKQRQ